MKAIDLVGRVFGRLQVVARAGSTDRTPAPPLWRCRCGPSRSCWRPGVSAATEFEPVVVAAWRGPRRRRCVRGTRRMS
jgi:hypothetical protein